MTACTNGLATRRRIIAAALAAASTAVAPQVESSAQAATTQAAPPYRIGYLVDASGSEQATIKPSLDGLNLYVNQLNRSGGIHGRPLEIVVRDTRSDLQQSLNAVNELAQNGVSGIVGLGMSNTHGPVYAAAQRLSLPVVAAFPANTPFVLPPAKSNAYGVGLAFNVTGVVAGRFAREVSPAGKHLTCVAFETAGSILACEIISKSAKAEGFSTVETVTVPIGLADFRSVVARIDNLNPDVVTDCLGRSQVAGLLPVLARSGYHGIFLSMDSAIGEDLLRAAMPPDSKVALYSYSRYLTDNDGRGAQADALRRAAAQAGIKQINASLTAGWVMGLVLTDALAHCAGDCNREQLNAALDHVDTDTGGLTAEPVRFTPTDHYGPSAYRLYRYIAQTQLFSPVGSWMHVNSSGVLAR